MIVVKRVDEIQVFPNDDGGISILQVDPMGDDNAIVAFPPEHADAMIEAIRGCAQLIANAE